MKKLLTRSLLKVLLLCLGMIVSISCFGQDKKLLWEISDDDSVVYLVGTVHALDWHDYPLDYLYEEAYRVADRVVFEVNLFSFEPEDAEDFIQKNGLYPKGQTIKNDVSNKTYKLLKEAAQEQGLDFNEVVKIKPWVWALSFIEAMTQQLDLDPELGVDQHFLDKAARDNKEIMELETWIDQFKVLSDAPLDKQGKYLDEIVNDLESNSISDDEAAVDAWRASDLSELNDLVVKMKKRDDFAYNRLITDRNNKWVTKIINYLNKPGITTVFAGAAHFAGENSVINLLQSKGHMAIRLPVSPRLLVSPDNHDQVLKEGSSLLLSYQFRSLYPIKYSWFHNGRVISGENNPTLKINSLTEDDTGIYHIMASTSDFSWTSPRPIRLVVRPNPKPPIVTFQPKDVTLEYGENAVFSVSAAGTPNLKYQWYKNGVQIEESTSSVLTINNATRQDEAIYLVRVVNEYGEAASEIAKLTVIGESPEILLQPKSKTINLGDDVKFTIRASGTGQIDYQWYKNGIQIEDATSRILTINNATKLDETIYSVRVKNEYGKAISEIVQLIVIANPPVITSQPISIQLFLGETAEFTVIAKGIQPFDYQWYKNGVILLDENRPQLRLNNVSENDEASYSVRIKNDYGKVVSDLAYLNVMKNEPVITKQPKSLVLLNGANAKFEVSHEGLTPIIGHWYKDNIKIVSLENEVKFDLNLKNINFDDVGDYHLVIENKFGISKSETVSLVLINKPVITKHPTTKIFQLGDRVDFKVSASGYGNFIYQWFKDGNPITSSHFKGFNTPKLIINRMEADDIGIYSVKVSNESGKTLSKIASLKLRDPDWVHNNQENHESYIMPLYSEKFDTVIHISRDIQWGVNEDIIINSLRAETGEIAWQNSFKAYQINDHPICIGDALMLTDSYNFYLFDLNTGKLRWKHYLGRSTYPVKFDEKNIIVGADRKILKINFFTREITLLKDFNSNKALVNNPSLHIKNIIKDSNGIIAVSLYEDHEYLYLLKPEESKYIVNKIKVGGIINSHFSADHNYLYFTTYNKQDRKLDLYSVDKLSNKINWIFHTDREGVSRWRTAPLIDEKNLYFNSNILYCINKLTGEKNWRFKQQDLDASDAGLGSALSARDLMYHYTGTRGNSGIIEFNIRENKYDLILPINYNDKLKTSLLLTKNGNLVFGTEKKLYAYQVEGFLPEFIWPLEFQNAQNTSSLTKGSPPQITLQPRDQVVELDKYAELEVLVEGSTPLNYQWYKNGVAIESGTKKALVIPNFSQNDIGIYSVSIKNQFGKVISRISELKKYIPPLDLSIANKIASPFTISFKTAEGATYIFQASSDLNKWSSIQEIEGTGNEVKVTDWREAIFQKQYYRVKLVE